LVFDILQICSYDLPKNLLLQLEGLPPENACSGFCRNSVTCLKSHTKTHTTEEKSCFLLLTKNHSDIRFWTGVNCYKDFTALLAKMKHIKETAFYI